MPLGSSTGAYKSGPVRLNVPVCVGAVVNPGDVLVGDENGLVAFPQEQVPMLTERAQAKLRLEQAIMVGIDGGAGTGCTTRSGRCAWRSVRRSRHHRCRSEVPPRVPRYLAEAGRGI